MPVDQQVDPRRIFTFPCGMFVALLKVSCAEMDLSIRFF
jgi:hypothetical protein